MYPTEARPYFGVVVARQVESLRREGVEIVHAVIAGDRGEADYLLARRRIAHLVRAEQPDLIHCHFGYTPLAAAFLGRPYVVTLCGDDVNGESDGRGGITLKSRLGILVTQLFALAAARVIVKSAAMRDRLWPSARRKAELVPNGVDEELFHPLPRREARRRVGIREGALVLGFVNSGGQATKRLDLAAATRDALVGRGQAAELLVAEHIPPAEMPWYYGAADCLLMTSDLEGSPNCVKEALACGVPVVSVPVGSVPELIDTPARAARSHPARRRRGSRVARPAAHPPLAVAGRVARGERGPTRARGLSPRSRAPRGRPRGGQLMRARRRRHA